MHQMMADEASLTANNLCAQYSTIDRPFESLANLLSYLAEEKCEVFACKPFLEPLRTVFDLLQKLVREAQLRHLELEG